MDLYAGIVVNKEAMAVDKLFTYRVPTSLEKNIEEGFRVRIPFGRNSAVIEGFVFSLNWQEEEETYNVKDIIELCDDFPILSLDSINLIYTMRNKYLCTYIECIKAFLPSGLLKGQRIKTEKRVIAALEPTGRYAKDNYTKIYKLAKENPCLYTKSQFAEMFSLSSSSINSMIKNGFLSLEDETVHRFDMKEYEIYEEKKLNADQEKVFNEILCSKERRFLLHGITGSGKTEVYMHLVSKMLEKGMDSIILIPEIALTPQMVERFKGRFGNKIALFHSKLSEGQRFDEWMRVFSGRVKVAIGARSAIFLPFKNLGLIVIDEEHENSYKSETDPKYNAREIAFMREDKKDCFVLLGSATPSVETYYYAKTGYMKILELNNRADGASLPKVEVVDMRDELASGNTSILSHNLRESLLQCIRDKEQAILFLNRRGFSTFVSCRKCGYVFKCKNCDISLTYHAHKNFLECHYCGYKERVSNTCPSCGSKYVKYFGSGTERLEEEIRNMCKDIKILRMDYDTTRKKGSYEAIYEDFKEGRGDILIGTQMVAKGLDFKGVTLVGVIAADLSLNIPDFRSQERTFQLLTQVSGRAGRGNKPGRVVIQTYSPNEYSVQKSAINDYEGFFQKEISIRETLNYPPFSKILVVNLSSKVEEKLKSNFQKISEKLHNGLKDNKNIIILGPSPCDIIKINDYFRWKIIIKGNITNNLAQYVKTVVYDCLKNDYNNIRISLDINPNSFI